jgi:uncharacterized protein YegL
MKSNLTELIFILDRSGSMGGLESDTIGGFNSMLAKQQEESGECRITTVLFDNEYELLHDRIDIKAVSPITEREYYVRGQTALLDAIGLTINKIGGVQRNTSEEFRAEKVMFIITTDGMENASREFNHAKIKSMIKEQKSKHGWEFIFIGANIDSVETAGRFGINADRAFDYLADKEGTQVNYMAMSKAALSFRKSGLVEDECFRELREDVQKRRKKLF